MLVRNEEGVTIPVSELKKLKGLIKRSNEAKSACSKRISEMDLELVALRERNAHLEELVKKFASERSSGQDLLILKQNEGFSDKRGFSFVMKTLFERECIERNDRSCIVQTVEGNCQKSEGPKGEREDADSSGMGLQSVEAEFDSNAAIDPFHEQRREKIDESADGTQTEDVWGQIRNYEAVIRELREENATMKKYMKTFKKLNKQMKNEANAAELEKADIQEQYKQTAEKYLEVTNENKELNHQLEEANTLITRLQQQNNELEEKTKVHDSDVLQLTNRSIKLTQECHRLEQTIEAKNNEISDLKKQIESHFSKLSHDDERVSILQTKLRDAEETIAAIELKHETDRITFKNIELHLEGLRLQLVEVISQRDDALRKLQMYELLRNSVTLRPSSVESYESFDQSAKARQREEIAVTAHLQKLFLEFFSQDNKTRTSLIPTILRLLKCPDVQIEQSVKLWRNSSGFFSF